MKKRIRLISISLAGLCAVAGVLALTVYYCVRQVPSFYRAAVEQDEQAQAAASDECLRQAAALASDVQRGGRWQAMFTAEQVNGWLAVDLPENYPDTLPPEFENPRIDIRRGLATLACGYKQSESVTVVSISFDLFLSAPNIVALRIRGVRAGLMPVPLASVLEGISAAARNFDLELEWRQTHGDPVALVRLPQAFDAQENEIRLESIELRDSLVYVSGRTQPAGHEGLAHDEAEDGEPIHGEVELSGETADTAVQARADSATNENVQR